MIKFKEFVPCTIYRNKIRSYHCRYVSCIAPKSDIVSNLSFKVCDVAERATERLSQVAEILETDRSFLRKSPKVYQIYSNDTARLFEDLRVSSSYNRQIESQICRGFSQSKSMRGLYLDQLFQSIMKKEFLEFLVGVKTLERSGLLKIYERLLVMDVSSAVHSNLESEKSSGGECLKLMAQCLDLLIIISVSCGEPLIGASFALQSKDISVSLKTETLEAVISALSVNDPLSENYHSFTIIKIMDAFERKFSPNVVCDAITNMASSQIPYFANILFDRIASNDDYNTHQSITPTTKTLISANIRSGNYYRAIRLWKMCHKVNEKFGDGNLSLLERLMNITPSEGMKEDLFLNHLSKSSYADPDLVDFSISYFGQRERFRPEFEYVSQNLRPPLKRNTLSSLFTAFITQEREEAAEKILQVIFKTNNGLNSEDFSVIINKLLSKSQVKQCVDMCISNDFSVSYKGSMKVLMHLLAAPNRKADGGESSNAMKRSFIKYLTKSLHSKGNQTKVYRLFTVTMLTHFSNCISNRASRKLFQNLSYNMNKAENESVNLLSYGVPSELSKFLVVDCENRLECLEVILRKAQKENDLTLISWCAFELQLAGVPIRDINDHYLKHKFGQPRHVE